MKSSQLVVANNQPEERGKLTKQEPH